MRSSVMAASGICLGGKILSAAAGQNNRRRPSIVVSVSDDQGYADSRCYISSPNNIIRGLRFRRLWTDGGRINRCIHPEFSQSHRIGIA